MKELADRLASEAIEPEEFWASRRCMREPIAEIHLAANMLDRAVGAHLAGDHDAARALIRQADMPVIRAYTEALWGSGKSNPEQWRYVRKRAIANTPADLAKSERSKTDMPSTAEKRVIVARDGHNCVFCGMPVIRTEVRKAIADAYADLQIWGNSNKTQHAAFQCLWLQYDHVFPRAKGGDNTPANVVVACAPCNYGRGNSTLAEVGVLDPRSRPVHRTSWDGLERFLPAR